MTDIFTALAAPFPQETVSWRAQSMNRDGTKAMALAYIDARDVMRRLDEVVGPANWQDSYTETPTGTALCTISIRCEGEWVSKCDGAGATDVEAEKGRISDAFKRCAVKWGIGRYLYDLDAPWVECESREGSNGKRYWSKWKADPWKAVKRPAAAVSPAKEDPGGEHDIAAKVADWCDKQAIELDAIGKSGDAGALSVWHSKNSKALLRLKASHEAQYDKLMGLYDDVYAMLGKADGGPLPITFAG